MIKISVTARPQAVYRYSNATRQRRRNLEDKVRDSDTWRQNIKGLDWFYAIIFHTLPV